LSCEGPKKIPITNIETIITSIKGNKSLNFNSEKSILFNAEIDIIFKRKFYPFMQMG
jgi:hypothetical protein